MSGDNEFREAEGFAAVDSAAANPLLHPRSPVSSSVARRHQ
jgi:hypothetical protein